MKVKNINGNEIDFETGIYYMDDDLREEIHLKLAPCTNQEFFTAYEIAHEKNSEKNGNYQNLTRFGNLK